MTSRVAVRTAGILMAALGALLSGCGVLPVTGSGSVQDSGPGRTVDVSRIPDAVPRVEPRTAAGNKSPYTVLGKTYRVMADSHGFTQSGVASWYGTKFHGRRTSNGEIYNMYGMTAAHKTLPIPSYVRVTNRNNGRSVVVRVNDRGPFHGGRIIDLTYTAAKKLGYDGQGTAPVTLEVLDPRTSHTQTRRNDAALSAGKVPVKTAPVKTVPIKKVPVVAASTTPAADALALGKFDAGARVDGYQLPDNTFLQAGAFGTESAALALQKKIATLTRYPVRVKGDGSVSSPSLFRVQIGPIGDNLELLNLREVLQKNHLTSPHVVYD